VKQKYLRFSFL